MSSELPDHATRAPPANKSLPSHALFDTLTMSDVRWACELFSRLSREQTRDAFRAAGFERTVAERYVQMIRAKVDHELTLSASSTSNTGRAR